MNHLEGAAGLAAILAGRTFDCGQDLLDLRYQLPFILPNTRQRVGPTLHHVSHFLQADLHAAPDAALHPLLHDRCQQPRPQLHHAADCGAAGQFANAPLRLSPLEEKLDLPATAIPHTGLVDR